MLSAFATANLVGISNENITKVLDEYVIENDRVQMFNINGKKEMLLTSKHENSISYNQSIEYIVEENKPCVVVIIVDAISRKYFTSDTSWLWDIDFERLNVENVKNIVLAGKYINDLMIRFSYTGIDKDKIIESENLDDMMKIINNSDAENIYVVTCFSDRMKFLSRR